MSLCSFLLSMLLCQWLVRILTVVEILKWTYLIMSDIITHHATLPIDGEETWTAFQLDCTLKQSDSGHSIICVVTTHIIATQTSHVRNPRYMKSKIYAARNIQINSRRTCLKWCLEISNRSPSTDVNVSSYSSRTLTTNYEEGYHLKITELFPTSSFNIYLIFIVVWEETFWTGTNHLMKIMMQTF